jgi:hypothetical protein
MLLVRTLLCENSNHLTANRRTSSSLPSFLPSSPLSASASPSLPPESFYLQYVTATNCLLTLLMASLALALDTFVLTMPVHALNVHALTLASRPIPQDI